MLLNSIATTWRCASKSPVYTIQPVVKPVVKPVWQQVVSCIQTFNRLSNPFDNQFDNRLYRVYSRLSNRLYNPVLTTGWTNSGCSFNTVVKLVAKAVWPPVRQLVGCLFTRYSRLSNPLYNWFDNWLYRVNRVKVMPPFRLRALAACHPCSEHNNCLYNSDWPVSSSERMLTTVSRPANLTWPCSSLVNSTSSGSIDAFVSSTLSTVRVSTSVSKQVTWLSCRMEHHTTTTTVYSPFSGTTRVSQCQRRTSGLYDARED